MAKTNLDRLADSVYAGTITHEDFVRAFETIIEKVNKAHEKSEAKVDKTLTALERMIDALDTRTGEEIESVKEECMNYVEAYVSEMASLYPEQKSRIDDILGRVEMFTSFTENDKQEIIEEISSRIPAPVEPVPETPDETVDKVNASTKQIKKERVEGLEDAMRIAAHNSVSALPPTTTSFFNNGKLVGRAKNLNVVAGTPAVSINGDTAILNLSATVSGVATVNSGTDITVDNTDPSNPVINFTGSSSGITRSINSISSPTTAGASASTDYVYLVSGTTTLTLPTAVSNTNRYTVKNVGANTVTIATTSSQTIDGSSTASLPVANTSLDLISNGTNWVVV